MSLKNNGCGCVMRTILIILGICTGLMVLTTLDGRLVIYAILFIILCCIALPVILPVILPIALITLLFKSNKNDAADGSFDDTSYQQIAPYEDEDEEDATRITYNQYIIQQNIYYLQNDQGAPEITDPDEHTWQ